MIGLYALNPYRLRGRDIIKRFGSEGDDREGMFIIPSPFDGADLRVIAASDAGWDHVSVSREDRCPSWEEMEFIKRAFFKPDETAFKLQVPASDHISYHPNCLHLWRPTTQPITRPPSWMVGPEPEQQTCPRRAGKGA